MFETDDTEDLKYKQLPNNIVAAKNDYYNRKYQPLQTLAVSNVNGLTFIASVKAYLTKDLILMQPAVPHKNNIPPYFLDLNIYNNFDDETFECMHVTINSDDSLLSISVIKFESSGHSYCILFYDIQTLKNLLFSQVVSYTEKASYTYALLPNENLLNLAWNPAIGKTLSFLSSKLFKIEISYEDSSYITHKQTLEYENKLTSICWSPKGKQLLGGLENGSILQIKYDLTVVKKIPAPVMDHTEVTSIKPINLTWISTYSIICCYQADHKSEDGSSLFFIHITTNKDPSQAAIYRCYEDPYYDTKASLAGTRHLGMGREERFLWVFHLPAWKNLLVGVSNDDSEIISFAPSESDKEWRILGIEDTFRPVLPVFEADGQTMEMFPVGAAIDYTTNCDVLFPRNVQYPPAPVLFVLTDTGLLCAFSIVATWPEISSLNVTPKPLTAIKEQTSIKPKTILSAESNSKIKYHPSVTSLPNANQSTNSTIIQHSLVDKSGQISDQPPFTSSSTMTSSTYQSAPAVQAEQTFTKLESSVPTTKQIDNVKAKNGSQKLSFAEIESFRNLGQRIDSLKKISKLYECKGRKDDVGIAHLPAFITLPIYLGSESSDHSLLQSKLAQVNKLTENLDHDVSLEGKERLLDTYASIELVGEVLHKTKLAKINRASCNPAIYKAPSAKGSNNSSLSRLADHVLYNFNERYRDMAETVNRLKRKIDLKIEEYHMESVDLMKKLRISDDTLTYNCLKVNSKILVQLEREYSLVLVRFKDILPHSTRNTLNNIGQETTRGAKGDTDSNLMIDQILKNLKKQSLDCKSKWPVNAINLSKTLNPKSRTVVESVCKRVANSKIRNIDISQMHTKSADQPRFDQIFSVAGSTSEPRFSSSYEPPAKTDLQRTSHNLSPIVSEKGAVQGNKAVVTKIQPYPLENVSQSVASIDITRSSTIVRDTFQNEKSTKNAFNISYTPSIDQIISTKPNTVSILSISSSVVQPKVEEPIISGSHLKDDQPVITSQVTPSSSEIRFTGTAVSNTSTPVAPVAPFTSPEPEVVGFKMGPSQTEPTHFTSGYPLPTSTPPKIVSPVSRDKSQFGFASQVQSSSSVFPSPMPSLLTSVVSPVTEDLKAPGPPASTISLPNFSFNINSNKPSKTVTPFSTAPMANLFGVKSNIPVAQPLTVASSASIFGSYFGGTANIASGENVSKTSAPTLFGGGSLLQGFGGGVKPVFGASASFGSPPATQSHLFGSAPVFGAPSPFTGFNAPSTLSQNPIRSSVGFGVSIAEAPRFNQNAQGSPSFAALAQMAAPSFGSLPQQQPASPPSAFGFGAAVPISSPAFGFGSMQNPTSPAGFGSPDSSAFGSQNDSASLGNSFMAYR